MLGHFYSISLHYFLSTISLIFSSLDRMCLNRCVCVCVCVCSCVCVCDHIYPARGAQTF